MIGDLFALAWGSAGGLILAWVIYKQSGALD